MFVADCKHFPKSQTFVNIKNVVFSCLTYRNHVLYLGYATMVYSLTTVYLQKLQYFIPTACSAFGGLWDIISLRSTDTDRWQNEDHEKDAGGRLPCWNNQCLSSSSFLCHWTFIVSIHTLYLQLWYPVKIRHFINRQRYLRAQNLAIVPIRFFPSDASGHGCRIRFQSINQRFFVQTSLQKGYNWRPKPFDFWHLVATAYTNEQPYGWSSDILANITIQPFGHSAGQKWFTRYVHYTSVIYS